MQTFLPFADFKASAEVLDKKRCWKQVVEAKQILCTLRYSGAPKDWAQTRSWLFQVFIHHPAVQMWQGHEGYLAKYFNIFLEEAKNRGINTSMEPITVQEGKPPWWLGNPKFHRAMRSRLIQKNPGFYAHHWPNDIRYNSGEYFWPDYYGNFKII